jgi:hypothetical protein
LESIHDLANRILFDNNWDPHTLYAPSQHLVLAMDLLVASVPFAEGAELIVDILVNPGGTGSVYIDDLIQATVIIKGTDNVIKCKCATLLATNTCAHPKHSNTPIPSKSEDSVEQTQSRGRLGGAKNCPGVATGHKTFPHTITREQVCHLDQPDHRSDITRNNNGQRSQEHHWAPWSSQNGNPICAPLLKQATQLPN